MQVAGLRAMRIKKFIGASYSALQNKIVLDYMTAAGFEALSMEPIDVPFDQVAQISVEALYAQSKGSIADTPSGRHLYPGWRLADGARRRDAGEGLGMPVVHATICEAWQIHKRLAVRETKPGYGRLLKELPS